MKRKICIWDLDNTLINTNEIWMNAKLNMLKALSQYLKNKGIEINPYSKKVQKAQACIDDILLFRFKYEFPLMDFDLSEGLILALYHHFSNDLDYRESVSRAVNSLVIDKKDEEDMKLVKNLKKIFRGSLNTITIPKIFDGAIDVLKHLSPNSIMYLITESSKEWREIQKNIIRYYSLDKFFDEIFYVRKICEKEISSLL
jgi:beta-phosphoglucomutase-like phosphatase (HAD superfamily)